MKKIHLSTFILSSLCAMSFSSRVLAQPGSGIRLGEATALTPTLRLSYNYDDNVNIRRRALDDTSDRIDENTSDTFYSYTAALNLKRFAGNRNMRLDLWYGENYYDSFSDLDGQNYGVNAGYFWGKPNGNTSFDISAGYEYAVDRAGDYDNRNYGSNDNLTNFETISERVERDITSTEARLNQKLGRDFGGALLFGYYATDYANPVYNDRTGYDYDAELNYDLSAKTQPYVRIGYGVDDDGGFVNDAEKPYVLVGLRYQPTEKTRIQASVGYEKYTRTPWLISYGSDADGRVVETGREPGEENENSHIKYDVNMSYQATQKTAMTLAAGNGYNSVSAGFGRSRQENTVSFTLRHRTTPRINQSILINFRKDEYFNDVLEDGEETFDEVKETYRYEYRLSYTTMRPWLSFFGTINYEDGSSEIEQENYDQTSISIGASLRY